MELLSNGNSVKLRDKASAETTAPSMPVTDRVFYSSFFKSNSSNATTEPVLVPYGAIAQDTYNNDDTLFSQYSHHFNVDLLPAIGSTMTPSTSPQTNSSAGSLHGQIVLGVNCGRCEVNATRRCLDCNDLLCDDCVQLHLKNPSTKNHSLIKINNSPPIVSYTPINYFSNLNSQCETHNEILRYLCETCKTIVCQECTLWGHKDHNYTPLKNVASGAKEKIQAILESGKLGTRYIKNSIDRAVAYSQAVERDSNECSARIRKAMRHFILAAEDRERVLIERVDKYRSQKLSSLNDQMVGLREALSGLSQTSENLNKALDSLNNSTPLEIASTLIRGESQMEQFAVMYKNLQPKEEFLNFVAPNFELLQEIRVQGDIMLSPQRGQQVLPSALSSSSAAVSRRPSLKGLPKVTSNWEIVSNITSSFPSLNVSSATDNVVGQCIPGSNQHVAAKPATGPTLTFGFDGHEDGQVSRPWGVCTDKDGCIIVADRRNNRVQVFNNDGSFKLRFGSKGTGDGQFDLPAGISTDPQNRICVVDKDNHRIQIFSANGIFVKKFGTYGKECGQFQYPWDIAINCKGEMLITDSRNHRIQLFNSNGHFITRFGFDGINHNRYLKGLTTPRGICFTPQGDVIVSDFENHRLLLIDSTLSKVIAAKGHEGSGTHEFSRPSGICCDDDGRVIVADSKNQRVIVFSAQLEFLWAIEIRPSSLSLLVSSADEKDRPSDVALLPDGRLVIMVETSPDARDQANPQKTFIQVY